MKLLSDDDLDLAGMSDEELAAAWDLWFDLAQATNDFDPPWTHGVFAGIREWSWERDVDASRGPGEASLTAGE